MSEIELERRLAGARALAFAQAARIAFAIRRIRCGCAHCESTATEIASVIQGNQLAEEIRAEAGLGHDRAAAEGELVQLKERKRLYPDAPDEIGMTAEAAREYGLTGAPNKHEGIAIRCWMICHPPEQVTRSASETMDMIADLLEREYSPETWRQ